MLPVIGALRPWADPTILQLRRLPMHVPLTELRLNLYERAVTQALPAPEAVPAADPAKLIAIDEKLTAVMKSPAVAGATGEQQDMLAFKRYLTRVYSTSVLHRFRASQKSWMKLLARLSGLGVKPKPPLK